MGSGSCLLIKDDSACLPLQQMCKTRSGSDDQVERMKVFIANLQPGWNET